MRTVQPRRSTGLGRRGRCGNASSSHRPGAGQPPPDSVSSTVQTYLLSAPTVKVDLLTARCFAAAHRHPVSLIPLQARRRETRHGTVPPPSPPTFQGLSALLAGGSRSLPGWWQASWRCLMGTGTDRAAHEDEDRGLYVKRLQHGTPSRRHALRQNMPSTPDRLSTLVSRCSPAQCSGPALTAETAVCSGTRRRTTGGCNYGRCGAVFAERRGRIRASGKTRRGGRKATRASCSPLPRCASRCSQEAGGSRSMILARWYSRHRASWYVKLRISGH